MPTVGRAVHYWRTHGTLLNHSARQGQCCKSCMLCSMHRCTACPAGRTLPYSGVMGREASAARATSLCFRIFGLIRIRTPCAFSDMSLKCRASGLTRGRERTGTPIRDVRYRNFGSVWVLLRFLKLQEPFLVGHLHLLSVLASSHFDCEDLGRARSSSHQNLTPLLACGLTAISLEIWT